MNQLNNILINFSIIFLLMILLILTYNVSHQLVVNHTEKVEFIYKNDLKPDNHLLERISKLEFELKRIEDINDKRFEILGWGFGLLITTIGLIILVSYVNSKAAMRDMVYEEINSKNKEFNTQYNTLLDEMKNKRDLINEEIEKLKQ